MASNFHNTFGWLMVGFDPHIGVQPLPPPPHAIVYLHLVLPHPFILGGNQKPKVLIDGFNSVVENHNPRIAIHIPISPDPLDMLMPLTSLLGNHKCPLSRGQVKICGTSAAICLAGPASINLDCAIPCTLPSSVILQVATVQTTPTAEDFKAAATKYAINAAVECFLFFASGGVAGAGEGAVANAVSLEEKGLVITFLKSVNPLSKFSGKAWENLADPNFYKNLKNAKDILGWFGVTPTGVKPQLPGLGTFVPQFGAIQGLLEQGTGSPEVTDVLQGPGFAPVK
ncbi:MAG: hypothetical protein U0359_33400 [Byssovorax sp.]